MPLFKVLPIKREKRDGGRKIRADRKAQRGVNVAPLATERESGKSDSCEQETRRSKKTNHPHKERTPFDVFGTYKSIVTYLLEKYKRMHHFECGRRRGAVYKRGATGVRPEDKKRKNEKDGRALKSNSAALRDAARRHANLVA